MSDARLGLRHGPRRKRRGLVALLLSTTLATCTTDHSLTGPGHGGRGFLAFRPVLAQPVNLAAFNLTIDGLRVIAIRPPSDTAADTTIAFPADSGALHLALPIVLKAQSESFTLVIQLRAGTKVLFSGTQTVQVSVGPPDSASTATIPLSYVGPGAGINHIHVTPVDSVVNEGGAALFRAVADSNGVPVDSFFVSWSTSDTTAAKINGQGLLHAPTARGAVFVRATTPTNVRDSTRITFIPTPAAIAVISGNAQSSTVNTRLPLPLRVQVTASDVLGIKGVPVKFEALSLGSVQDSIVVTDSAGFAEDTVTLGTTSGPQLFRATVASLKPDTFTVTATAGAISAAKSVVTVSSAIVAGGTAATLTLQAKDGFGNNLSTGGATVAFSASGGTSTGTISATTDHGDGSYTATFTALTAGSATTIGATVNSAAVTTTLPTITVTAGAISPLTSVVTTSAGSVSSGSNATLTLQAKDSAGNLLSTGGATVLFTHTGGTSTGTIGATTDHANGTYTATFTGDTAGTATTIHATIGGVAVTSTTSITVVAGNTVAAKSVISVSKDTVASGTTATLTLQAKDTAGNNIATGGLTVVFSHAGGTSGGTIGTTTDNGNGTYTAIFTGDTAGTATTIHATIGGVAVTSTLPTIIVTPGVISPVKSLVTSSDSVTTTGGVLTLTLQSKDAAGNLETKGGATVVFTQTGGTSTGTISATTDNNNGTYTATFTGVNGGTATTIGATIAAVAVTSTPLPTIRVISTVHSADITADETWVAGTHTVTAYIKVRNGAKLTIAVGATVKFDAGAGLQIGDTTLAQTGGLLMDGTQGGAAPGITLTANTATPTPGFWKGIEVQRNVALTTWRRTLIEWAGGTRTPFGSLPAEACVLFVNRSGAEVDLDSLRIRQCVHAGVHHFGGVSHIHRSEIDSVTGSGIHADLDAQLELDSNTVRGSGQEGLLLGSVAMHLLPSTFNRFVGNATFGIQMQAFQLPGLLKQDSIAGNGTDFIAVNGGQPDPTVAAFTVLAQPQRGGFNGYLIQNGLLDVGRVGGQTITLDSNLVLRFTSQSGIVIGDSAGTRTGTIVSRGTNRTNAPRLTSASLSPAPGDWYGLEIGRLASNTRLANVRIDFAGDSIPGRSRHRFGLMVRSPASQTLSVDSVIVTQSGRTGSDTNTAGIGVLAGGSGVDVRRSVAQSNIGYGFVVDGTPRVKLVGDTARSNTIGFGIFTDSAGTGTVVPGDSVAGNVATGNTAYPISIEVPRLHVLYGNALTGNGRDTVLLNGGTVTVAESLPKFAGVPWRVTGPILIDSSTVFTIPAGDTIAFDSLAGIVVGSNADGALAATGTAPAPILMTTSYTPTGQRPHGWSGILWRIPSASGNSFTFVTVDKGGYVFDPHCDCSLIEVGALRFADTTVATAVNLTLDHITVRNSYSFAVDVRRNGTGTVSITNSQFYQNGASDPMIRAFIGQPNQLTISGSDLYHYRGWIIQATNIVAATNNWWGDVAGLDSGYAGQDSMGRAALDFNPVSFTPFRSTPAFPVGSVVGAVTTTDSLLSPTLSTSDSIRVRIEDAFGRGVAGGTVNWSVSPPGQTTIAPTIASIDAGGRADANWTFTNSAGTKIATAAGPGTPAHYVASVQPGLTVSTNWALLGPLSQGTVTAPKAITFTSTNRRGVLITKSVDQFSNPTQPFYCTATPGFGCVGFSYATIDSVHTSGGANGDSVFFHSLVTTPSPFVLRGQYNTATGQVFDSVLITMNPAAAGVKIDRNQFLGGVQTTPDTVVINSLCPTGPGNFACQGTYNAFVVDSGLTPVSSANANFQWNLVSGSAVSFDSATAVPPHDVGFVTARTNGVVRLAVKDLSGNNFGTDTLPILVQQLPYIITVAPDTVSVPVGQTTTFRATVVDQAGDTMTTTPVHWRRNNPLHPHLTIIDTATVNQAKVRLDSTPFGTEYLDAFAVRGPGDTAFGSGGVVNPLVLRLTADPQPWALAVNSQTHAVYAAHQGGEVTRVNGATDVVVDSVSAGVFTSAVAVNAITNRVFVGTDAGVRVLDGATLGTVTTVASGTTQRGVTNRQGLTVDSVNNRIYVTVDIGGASANPVLRRIDGGTNTFSATNDVPLPGLGTGAAFDPVNGLVYVAIPDSNLVVAVDPVAKTFTRIAVGTQPFAVALNPVTNRVYSVNQTSDDISVIDGATQSVITTIPTGFFLTGIGVDPVSNRVYIGVSSINEVLVIDGNTDTFINTVVLGFFGDEVFGIGFDASNKKLWTANYSSSSVARVEF